MRIACLFLLLIAHAAVASPRLRVITYNIHFGAGPAAAQVAWGPGYVDRIAEMLVGQNPDVVGLQEVMAGGAQSGFVNQRRRLAERTGWTILYKEARHYWGMSSGIAILTRHPVLEERVVEVMAGGEVAVPGTDRTEYAERRLAQAAKILVPGFGAMWFVNTHFHSGDGENRRGNFDALEARLLRYLRGPVVMLGDFNSRTPKADGEGREMAYGRPRLLTADGAGFVDALAAVGKTDPRTFLSPVHFRLDWVFASERHFTVENAFVTGWELSDHEAIVATLVARDQAMIAGPATPAAPVLGPSGTGPALSLLGVR